MKLSREVINKACEWWADRLKGPTFDHVGKSRSKLSKSELASSDAASLMALQATEVVSAQQLDKFKEALAAELSSWDRNGSYHNILSCDYGPCQELADAAKVAGVNTANFPWKTVMWLAPSDGKKLSVALGYGAAPVDLL